MFVTDIVHCDSDISIGCDTPLTILQKLLWVLSSVRHFFSVAHDTPLTLFQKILRVLSSVRHFFSVARDTIIVCKLSLKEGEDKILFWCVTNFSMVFVLKRFQRMRLQRCSENPAGNRPSVRQMNGILRHLTRCFDHFYRQMKSQKLM